MTQEELNKIIEDHQHWLKKDCDGWESMRADLSRANLSGVSLDGVSLNGANLNCVSLNGVSLNGANLSRASLVGASLNYASLNYASLNGANLSRASLIGANLSRASLNGASLDGAKIDRTTKINFPISCPSHGEFVGWKKVKDKIIKLKIPDDAKRCSATTAKCRCDKALVLEIQEIDGTTSELTEIMNYNYVDTTYRVGEMVYPNSFDDNRWNECSHGIHFFIDREEAVRY